MAHRVIDFLETIQVQEKHADKLVVSGSMGYGQLEAVMQQVAVGKTGQCVIVDQLLNFALGPGTCRDVQCCAGY